MNVLHAIHLGPVDYRRGLELQEAAVRARAAQETPDCVLYPDHPPVLTVGRSPSDGALRADSATLRERGIEVFEVSRGGDITWHGPGQLVAYPILDLARRGRDVHRYLRDLEQTLLNSLAAFGIESHRSTGRTGVWVGERKIASIGVAVRKWVSYHGLALNVAPDLAGFELIHPCGLHGVRMTSMAEILGADPGLEVVRDQVTRELASVLGYEQIEWQRPERYLEAISGREPHGTAA
jgi:lipoate-protein ligase B